MIAPTFSGGHVAIPEQQHVNEASEDRTAFNRSPRPESAFRIPRRISSIIVPKVNGAPQGPVGMRSVSAAGMQPIRTDGGDKTPVKRRHSLSSPGGGYHFTVRRRTEDAAIPDYQGAKKGKGKLLRKKTRDFAKINGRISSNEDHSEYPDEARDTFSQQSPTFAPTNRPSSGFFQYDERRFSAGEGSVSSRFREDL